MKLIQTNNYNELSSIAAQLIVKEIHKKNHISILFPTGKTPLGMYKELVRLHKKKKADLCMIKSFNLDEYYPIKKSDKKSFYYYMNKNLFSRTNIHKENIYFLSGETKNVSGECKKYEKLFSKNKIDLAILGVGVNGHIGFNEPGSKVNSQTRIVKLSEETIKINFDKGRVPGRALTVGIKTILRSKKIILLADGNSKKEAIEHLLGGKVSEKWPVTFLTKHKNLTVVIDKSVLK